MLASGASFSRIIVFAGLTASACLSFQARAQTAATATLPGGASALNEVHGDWTVACVANAAEGGSARICAMTQQQRNAQGQRVVAVELQSAKDGVTGTLVLPFGLSVIKPVALTIGETAFGKPLAFSTCLQAGCLVPLNFGKAEVAALRSGATLTAAAGTLGGGSVAASISLKGFTTAIDRTQELSRQEGSK